MVAVLPPAHDSQEEVNLNQGFMRVGFLMISIGDLNRHHSPSKERTGATKTMWKRLKRVQRMPIDGDAMQ